MNEVPQYLTRLQAAARCGIHPTTIDRAGPKPDVRIGGHQGWSEQTIDEWFAQRYPEGVVTRRNNLSKKEKNDHGDSD